MQFLQLKLLSRSIVLHFIIVFNIQILLKAYNGQWNGIFVVTIYPIECENIQYWGKNVNEC